MSNHNISLAKADSDTVTLDIYDGDDVNSDLIESLRTVIPHQIKTYTTVHGNKMLVSLTSGSYSSSPETLFRGFRATYYQTEPAVPYVTTAATTLTTGLPEWSEKISYFLVTDPPKTYIFFRSTSRFAKL